MNESNVQQEILRSRKHTALWFGLIAGLVFSFFLWGIDAILLASNNAFEPWAKFLIGVLPVTLLCIGIAALSNSIDNGLISFLLWLAAGILISLFASHLPFEGLTQFYRIFNPEIAARVSYPFNKAVSTNTILALLICGPIGGISGVFFGLLVENVTNSSTVAGKIVAGAIWCAFFVASAVVISTLILIPLRNPLIAMNRLVDKKLIDEVTPYSLQDARYMHLSTLDTAGDLIHQPRKLVLAGYDSMQIQSNVKINFGGHWMDCVVIADQSSEPPRQQPVYCKDTN